MPGSTNAVVPLSGKGRADFLLNRGRERSSMFFRRGRDLEFIKAGVTFRRERSDRTIEFARVLSVAADAFGIPHVRYEVTFEKSFMTSRIVDGPRVLALSTFADTYQERV